MAPRDLLTRRPDLRTRVVLLSSVAVLAVLGLSVLGLGYAVQRVLVSTAIDAATLRAQELGDLASGGQLPAVIAGGQELDTLAQVVVDGRVLAASDDIDGEGPVATFVPGPGAVEVREVDGLPIDDDETFELVAVGISTDAGDGVVYVGVGYEQIEEFIDVLERTGTVGVPVLALLLAFLLWQAVGRALQPIDAMTTQAAAIGGDNLSDRIPVPPTDDEVARLATTINAMLGRLEDSAVRERRFSSDAAHELRSPLASLRVQLESARARRNVDWDEVSADLLDETLRMQALGEQLLSMVGVSRVAVEQHAHPCDLDDIAADVVARVRQRDEHTRLRIDTAGLAPVRLRGSATLLDLLVRNLVDNATRHAESVVVVSTRTDQNDVVLTVEDDGPGIAVDDRERVFDPFVRIDDARTRVSGGTGLGLALSRDIARAHDGSVSVDGSPSHGGARLTVRLPVGDDDR